MRAPELPRLNPAHLRTDGLAGPAVRQAARQYVQDGEPLATFLTDLEVAFQALDLPPPSTAVVKQASIAWADEFLGGLEGLACRDPLTGMSSAEHARVHLRSLYRALGALDDGQAAELHALVVVSLIEANPRTQTDPLDVAFHDSLRLATVADLIRTIFGHCEVVTALDPGRVLAVVSRDAELDDHADALAWHLRRRLPVSSAPRVLVEEMPPAEDQAIALLDALTA